MGGIDASVGFPCEEEDGGVGGAVIHAVEGRVGVKCLELFEIFYGTKLGDVECAVGIEFDAEHVKDAHVGDDGACELRILCEERAHEEAAIAAALDGKFFGTCVASLDEVVGACGEIIEHVLFVSEISGEVPLFAVLASAAEVCNHVDSPLVEPETVLEVESGTHAVSITPVSVEECGIVPIERRPFLFENVHRHAGSVFADGKLSKGLDVAEIDGGGVAEGC